MKVLIKRTKYGNLPFSSCLSLILVEEKDMASNKPIFEIYINFENLTFLKNYPANSEIKGITERKKVCESHLR